jgi:hypothetical protein
MAGLRENPEIQPSDGTKRAFSVRRCDSATGRRLRSARLESSATMEQGWSIRRDVTFL